MRTLSSEDAFLLYIETPDQHQHIIGTMILDLSTAPGTVDIDALIEHYREEMQQCPGFSQRLVSTPLSMTPPVLDEDPDFAFRNHIRHIAVPAPGTMQQLTRIVEDIASTQLDHRRPLWECWYISGLEHARLAVVFKVHHCLTDGVHGVQFMARLFDSSADKRKHHYPAVPAQRKPWWLLTYRALQDQRRFQPSYQEVFKRTLRSVRHRHKLFAESKSMADLVPKFFESAPKLKFNAPISPYRSVAMGRCSTLRSVRLNTSW